MFFYIYYIVHSVISPFQLMRDICEIQSDNVLDQQETQIDVSVIWVMITLLELAYSDAIEIST